MEPENWGLWSCRKFNLSLPAGYYAFAYRVVSTADGSAGTLTPIGTPLVSLSVV